MPRFPNIHAGSIQFQLGEDKDGRHLHISKSIGLVLKTFSDDDDFEAERGVYNILSGTTTGADIAPKFLGCFVNHWCGVHAVLLGYGGETLPDDYELGEEEWCVTPSLNVCALSEIDIRSELVMAVDALHALHIHHHDLKWDNILRQTSGRLLLIDFHLSDINPDCPEDTCPDRLWLNEGGCI